MIIDIHQDRHADLPQIIGAESAPRAFPCPTENGYDKRHYNGDNGYDYKKFQ